MTDVVAGIKEEELRSLSLEILSYRDIISIVLSEIHFMIKSLDNYYQGPPCKKILAKYDDLSDQYPVLGSNLKNYSKDLQAVIKKMHAGEKKLSSSLNKSTSEFQEEIKSKKELTL